MERFFTRRAGPPVTGSTMQRPSSRWSSGHVPEEEARREAELGRAVHKDLVRLGGHARGTPRDLAAGEAASLVAPRHAALR